MKISVNDSFFIFSLIPKTEVLSVYIYLFNFNSELGLQSERCMLLHLPWPSRLYMYEYVHK